MVTHRIIVDGALCSANAPYTDKIYNQYEIQHLP